MKNLNANFTTKLSTNVIEEFEKTNYNSYQKSINQNMQQLMNFGKNMTQVINNFEDLNQTYAIIGYNYHEQLTTLSGSNYGNTLSYLALKTDSSTTQLAKTYLKLINQKINELLENAFSTIENSFHNIIDNGAFNTIASIKKGEIYVEFYPMIIEQLATRLIPNVLETFINSKDLTLTETNGILNLINNIDEIINALNNKILILTKLKLTEIYTKFKAKPIDNLFNLQNNKIPFVDFDHKDIALNIKFNQQDITLKTLIQIY